MASKLPERWKPYRPTGQEIEAAKAMSRHDASPHQQEIFVEWLFKVSGQRDEIFVPGQADVAAYLLGRRSVFLQFADLLKMKAEGNPNA